MWEFGSFDGFITMVSKRRPVKRLLSSAAIGSGRAQILEKPSDLTHLIWVASQGKNGIRNRLIIWMLFGSGMRINETAHLKISDVIHPSGDIKPVFSISAKYTKTGNPRAAYILASEHVKTLESWLSYRIENNIMMGATEEYRGLNPSNHLILFAKGRVWRNPSFQDKKYTDADKQVRTTKVCRSIENLSREIIKSAGFTFGSSHSGRRTLATWLDRKGFSLELIQMILGHENPNMSLVYIEPWQKRIDDAFKKTLDGIKFPHQG